MADPSLPKKAVDLALQKFSRIDSLIINHGSLDPVKKVSESSAEEWSKAFDINVFSAVGLVQAALPSLRATKGRIVLTSSGAAQGAYQGWGAYGAGKAVLNHLVRPSSPLNPFNPDVLLRRVNGYQAMTLAVEEPDVTTISIRPGVVDTEMQREIREVHHERMSDTDREKFSGLKSNGGLLRPEQPGHVIAKLAVGGEKELSGKFLSWDDESLSAFQE
jgi:NAD(P)-dependent dehydrogenase (short-subunit alcohol dehydrogenase family)